LPVRGLVVGLGLLAAVLIAVAISILIWSWNAVAVERAELEKLVEVECTVLRTGMQTILVPAVATPNNPNAPAGAFAGDWRYLPRVLIAYEVEGQPVEQWVDVGGPFDSADAWEAQRLLDRYRVGDQRTAWYERSDSSAVHFEVGEGGGRTLLMSRIAAGLLLLPAVGLLLAAAFIWRALAKPRAVPSAARVTHAAGSP
jgi:hypothetical protein